jgi:hypothetical protein
MHAIALLTITATLFGAQAALADVKRREFIPEALRGSWALSADECKATDKSAVVVVSAKTYVTPEGSCSVAWVSETPGGRGSIYAADLNCSKPAGNTQKMQSTNVIFIPRDANRVSIGPGFDELKDYQRCSAN